MEIRLACRARRTGAMAFAVGCFKQAMHVTIDPISNFSAGAVRARSTLA
jgi:hypothetical protein